MKERYLEVTFRKGKAVAAYLYLPRDTGATSARTEKVGEGLLVDYGADGRPIGIEIVSPDRITLDEINAVLSRLHLPPLAPGELAPLQAA
jgi:uncharacterized protein YuzE